MYLDLNNFNFINYDSQNYYQMIISSNSFCFNVVKHEMLDNCDSLYSRFYCR